jgi:hypothetical protein
LRKRRERKFYQLELEFVIPSILRLLELSDEKHGHDFNYMSLLMGKSGIMTPNQRRSYGDNN